MIQHPFAHFEGGLLFGVIFVSVLELHAYLSYKKNFLLGLIIPIGFFLFNVYHFWSNSLKETLYIIFYDTINLVPLFIILICEFIVFKIGGTLKRKNAKGFDDLSGFIFIGALLFISIQVQIVLCLKKYFRASFIIPVAYTIYLLLYYFTSIRERCIHHTYIINEYLYVDIIFVLLLFLIYPVGRFIFNCFSILKK